MLLAKGSKPADSSPAGMKAAMKHRRPHNQRTTGFFWACCTSLPSTDEFEVAHSGTQVATDTAAVFAAKHSSTPCFKYSAACVPSEGEPQQPCSNTHPAGNEALQQQLCNPSSPTPPANLSKGYMPAVAAAAAAAALQHAPEQRQQQQPAGHFSSFSIGVHASPTGLASVAAEPAGTVRSDSGCTMLPLPLTSDSLTRATAVFGSFNTTASTALGFHRPTGASRQKATHDSPSDVHSTCHQSQVISSFSAGNNSHNSYTSIITSSFDSSSSSAAAKLSPGHSSSTPSDLAALGSAQQQTQQQQQQQLVLPDLQQQTVPQVESHHSATAAVLSIVESQRYMPSADALKCQATMSSVAGYSEKIMGSCPAAAAAATGAGAGAGAGGKAAAVGNAGTAGPLQDGPGRTAGGSSTEAPTASAASAAALNAASADLDTSHSNVVDTTSIISSSLPPHLISMLQKLRKLESGLSFKMLHTELSAEAATNTAGGAASAAEVGDGYSGSSGSMALQPSMSAPMPDMSYDISDIAEADPATAMLTAAVQTTVPVLSAEEGSSGPRADCNNSKFAHVDVAGCVNDASWHAADKLARQGIPPSPSTTSGASAQLQDSTNDTLPVSPAAAQPTVADAVDAAAIARDGQAVSRTPSASSSPFAQVGFQQSVAATMLAPATTSQQQQQQQQQLATAGAVASGIPVTAAAAAAAMATSPVAASSSSEAAAANSGTKLSATMVAAAAAAAAVPVLRHSVSSSSGSGNTAMLATAQQLHSMQAPLGPAAPCSTNKLLASRMSWASAATLAEPQVLHVFQSLDPGSTGTTGGNSSTHSNSNSILRPTKSASNLVGLHRKGKFGSSSSSSRGRLSSSFSFSRSMALSSASISWAGLGKLRSAKSASSLSLKGQPSPDDAVSAASADRPAASVPAASSTAADSRNSSRMVRGNSSSSSSGGNSMLMPVASAPAAASGGSKLLKGILRRSADFSSAGLSTSSSAAAAAAAAAVNPRRTKTVHLSLVGEQHQHQHQLAATTAAAAATPFQFARLPPLPRPPSAASLDATTTAAAAAAAGGGGSSPFAAPQALPPGLEPIASSSSSICYTSGFASTASVAASHCSLSVRSPAGSARLPLPDAPSTGSSSLGFTSSSSSSCSSSTGTASSLLSLAVSSIQHSASEPAAAAAAAAGAHSSLDNTNSSSKLTSAASLNGISAAASSKDSISAATAFAEAFLAALAAGNTKWASDAAVGQLLHEAAKMVGLDKQLYVGKAAIIRRLNSGMEQLVKMASATLTDSSSSNSNNSNGSSSSSTAAPAESVIGVSKLPKPQLTVSCPEPKAKPSQVVAVYTFKWGIRKFTMRDEFIVKGGQIMRLRRLRG